MDNEELEKIMKESTEFVDRLKDKVHEQYFEIERLNNIIQRAIIKLENEIRYLKHLDKIGAMCSTEQVSFNNSLLKELKGEDKE